jgi:hypothetical protein
MRIRRFVNRRALRAHESQVSAILGGLTVDELEEARLTLAELGAMVERHAERRAAMMRAAG